MGDVSRSLCQCQSPKDAASKLEKSAPSKDPARAPREAPKEPLRNAPGRWDFFLSHTQRNGCATALAEKIHASLEKYGHTVWLDVHMKDKSEAAMQEGVHNAKCVIAIITGCDGTPGTSYFERPFCLKELRWAADAGVFVQPVIQVDDKSRILELMRPAPEDQQYLIKVDWVDLIRSDPEYWEVGINKLRRVLGREARPAAQRSKVQAALLLHFNLK